MASVIASTAARAGVQPMLPIMMSARPLLTDCTVADHSICAETTPSPIFLAIVAMISASEPISLPSSMAIIGISLLFAMVSTPGATVLNSGAAAARLPDAVTSAAPAPAMKPRRHKFIIAPLPCWCPVVDQDGITIMLPDNRPEPHALSRDDRE